MPEKRGVCHQIWGRHDDGEGRNGVRCQPRLGGHVRVPAQRGDAGHGDVRLRRRLCGVLARMVRARADFVAFDHTIIPQTVIHDDRFRVHLSRSPVRPSPPRASRPQEDPVVSPAQAGAVLHHRARHPRLERRDVRPVHPDPGEPREDMRHAPEVDHVPGEGPRAVAQPRGAAVVAFPQPRHLQLGRGRRGTHLKQARAGQSNQEFTLF